MLKQANRPTNTSAEKAPYFRAQWLAWKKYHKKIRKGSVTRFITQVRWDYKPMTSSDTGIVRSFKKRIAYS